MKIDKIMASLEAKHPGEMEYLQAVKEVTADTLVLTDGTEIPVSREKRKEILAAFMQFQKL